ncbi:MAG: nucleoside triphosphate pyrophosphohydrolase [Desulfatiglans sp.]|jgi:MazG family protein|nr:nucleoside triphosphate pyrophosphohydrolase [Desulfatiglans sp.]
MSPPKKNESKRLSKAVLVLQALVRRLRGPGGCPWDAKQTDGTIKIYLLEEAYEVLEAIETSSSEDICEELGDLLFQILFLVELASERGEFNLVDVIEKTTDKMIRRHPHVFGDQELLNAEDVASNWEKIKQEEREAENDKLSSFHSVPIHLPALLRAHRLSERAAKVDFDWAGPKEIWEKVEEEFEELRKALEVGDREEIGEEIGDLLFSIVNLSRHWGLNAENLLRLANGKFLRRIEKMHQELESSGLSLEDASPKQMDQAWERIKNKRGL